MARFAMRLRGPSSNVAMCWSEPAMPAQIDCSWRGSRSRRPSVLLERSVQVVRRKVCQSRMAGAGQAARPSARRARWKLAAMARAARSLAVTTHPPARSHAVISASDSGPVSLHAPIPALYATGAGGARKDERARSEDPFIPLYLLVGNAGVRKVAKTCTERRKLRFRVVLWFCCWVGRHVLAREARQQLR